MTASLKNGSKSPLYNTLVKISIENGEILKRYLYFERQNLGSDKKIDHHFKVWDIQTFRDPLTWSTFCSTDTYFVYIIQKEPSYTYLISTELLQKQASFDKIGRSLAIFFLNFDLLEITKITKSLSARSSEITVLNGEIQFMFSRISYPRKTTANWNFEHKFLKWISFYR